MTNWHLLIFNFSIIFYTLSTFIYLYSSIQKNNYFSYNLDFYFMITAFLLQFVFLIVRWIVTGHAPMTTMFEYLNVFGFFIALSYIAIYQFFKIRVVGLIVNLLILLIMIFSSISSKDITPIVPALNSYWLGLHVSLAALGEGLFAISFIASFLYLIKNSNSIFTSIILEFVFFLFLIISNLTISLAIFETPFSLFGIIGVAIYLLFIFQKKTLATTFIKRYIKNINSAVLDQLSYQSIAFGYPIFTLGALVFAMIWADQAWGSYWSWDPKETWALISWLFYGLYLHLRLLKGWREKETAWISFIGFIIILFTLLGVTYLLPGNHTYI